MIKGTEYQNSRPVEALKQNWDKPSFRHLLGIGIDALDMWPPYYVQSFLGPIREWLPPHHRYSEFTFANPWQLMRAIKYLLAINVPSFSAAPPVWLPGLITDLFWQMTEILPRPDYYNSFLSYPEEQWFFINGIMTNTAMGQLNSAYLTYLFHRPMTMIQNATDGWYLDLFECVLGKEWYQNTESAIIAMPVIYNALKNSHKKKVVVVCHSQGTIIMGVILRALKVLGPPEAAAGSGLETVRSVAQAGGAEYVFQDDWQIDPADFDPLTDDEWAKLEIYAFANCSTRMEYFKTINGCPAPWIESFGNEKDLVARLGMLAPRREQEDIIIDGPIYMHAGKWGHLLNQSYLAPIEKYQKGKSRRPGGKSNALPFTLTNPDTNPGTEIPRLFSYINGGSPEGR